MTNIQTVLRYALEEYASRLIESDFDTIRDEGKPLYDLLLPIAPEYAASFRLAVREAHELALSRVPSRGWLSDNKEEYANRVFLRWAKAAIA